MFCKCPAGLYTETHDGAVLRHMRPTLSELGEYDGTALMEFKTKKNVVYLLHKSNVCTYEMDDTPPFLMNLDALDVAADVDEDLPPLASAAHRSSVQQGTANQMIDQCALANP